MSGTLLHARDGHVFGAHVARPVGTPKGGVVILQEIFGLDPHTRHVADHYAEAGYLAVAPSMFDRIEPAVVLGYDQVQKGLELMQAISQDHLVADLQAAIDAAGAGGTKVVPIGFCWGGALAYLAACRCHGLAAAVAYYGTRIQSLVEIMTPRVPVLYQFGALDKSIPPAGIEKIRAADQAGVFHVYEGADHAFANAARPNFNPEAAALAERRTMDFIAAR